jgi:AraC-like DNA-binding protein
MAYPVVVPRSPGAPEPIALRLERSAELEPGARREDGPALVFPLEQCVVTLAMGHAPPERLDRSTFAVVPAGEPHRLRAASPITALATLVLRDRAIERAAREYRGAIDATELRSLLGSAPSSVPARARPRVLPRTRWVDEIVHRYVFERDVCERHASAAAVFLETEIVKESYFLSREHDAHRTRVSVVHEEGDVVQRARAWIEGHLFTAIRVAELAKHCATSESTLLRAFQRELGSTPATYARERRLDAALLLLKSGRYRVGEVAERVGYTSLAAFTEAFHKQYGVTPSHARARTGDVSADEVLPPHGQPPRRKRRRV